MSRIPSLQLLCMNAIRYFLRKDCEELVFARQSIFGSDSTVTCVPAASSQLVMSAGEPIPHQNALLSIFKGDDVSQLWWWCCCRFLFWGAQGASQLPGCEGEGGAAGNGGESASGAVKGECFESALEFGGGNGGAPLTWQSSWTPSCHKRSGRFSYLPPPANFLV